MNIGRNGVFIGGLLLVATNGAMLSGCATTKDENQQVKTVCIGLPCLMPWNKPPEEKPNTEVKPPVAASQEGGSKTPAQQEKVTR